MIVTGWKIGTPNIKTGSGYGIRIKLKDRNKYFSPDWESVKIEFGTGEIFEANLSVTFWGKCPELRSHWIGKWMLNKGYMSWPKFKPRKMRLEPVGGRVFKLRFL